MKEIYAGRRKKAVSMLGDRFLLVSTASIRYSANNSYPMDEDSNFYYLTGLTGLKGILLLTNFEEPTIFLDQPTKEAKIWQHFLLEDDVIKMGINKVLPLTDMASHLLKVAPKTSGIVMDPTDNYLQKYLNHYNLDIFNITNLVGRLRLIKDNYEITNIEKAIAITKAALKEVELQLSNLKNESDIMAILDSFYASNKCYRSFFPIVASGNNANVLHYDANNQKLENMVLIDTGVKYNGYASDITRTFLIKKNKYQEAIYNLVMEAKVRSMAIVKPKVTLKDVHQEAVNVIVNGLIKLKILKGSPSKIIKDKSYADIYPHSTSHFLGLDTHDPFPGKDPKTNIKLQKGMVITIEPGIYLNLNNNKIPKEYRGIGIRLEDDVLVTATGFRNLSADK